MSEIFFNWINHQEGDHLHFIMKKKDFRIMVPENLPFVEGSLSSWHFSSGALESPFIPVVCWDYQGYTNLFIFILLIHAKSRTTDNLG